MGVLRWRSVLDDIVATHISQAPAKLDLEVVTALRLGAYQLFFLDRIPAHAAINDSVELVKNARKRSAAGFVNAVLRKIDKGPRTRKFDPTAAHPDWLVNRWGKNYGIDPAFRICEYDQTPPTPAIRITDPALCDELKNAGVVLSPGRLVAGSFYVHGDITKTNPFRERRLLLQDEGSQLVALLVGNGRSILDCCAAPGGKTRILADRNPDAQILAIELHPHRAALMRKLVPNPKVQVIAADARSMPFVTKFDRILVDAPCSGTGTLARNPEIKWRLKQEDLLRLQKYQIEILAAAIQQLACGGRIVYSTCSLEPEENEQVVKKVLEHNGSLKIIDCALELKKLELSGELAWKDLNSLVSGRFLRTIPGVHPCDGFFAAILERI
jgi:16S rRNA (cytosine967-C5)-methyltransferase